MYSLYPCVGSRVMHEFELAATEYARCGKMYSTVNNNTNDFVSWLKGEMKARGWSQAELARRAGVTRGAIGNVLRGDRGPGRDLLIAIAGALNYPSETVFRQAQFFPETGEDPRFEILR